MYKFVVSIRYRECGETERKQFTKDCFSMYDIIGLLCSLRHFEILSVSIRKRKFKVPDDYPF